MTLKPTTRALIRNARANKGASPPHRKIMAGAKRRIMKRIGRKNYRNQILG